MDPLTGILLAMQAAGMIVDYSQTRRQQGLIRAGREIEQAQYEANLESLRAQTEQESLFSMQQLRSNIGTQIAVQAARGTSSAAGTAVSLRSASQKAFAEDERTRRMNLLAKEADLRASNVLSGLHTSASESQLGQAMAGRFLNLIPLSQTLSDIRGGMKGGKQNTKFGAKELV
jgi:hypothetical protein